MSVLCRQLGRLSALAFAGLFVLSLLSSPVRAVNNGDVPVNTPESARRVINALIEEFGSRYTQGKDFLTRLGEIEAALKEDAGDQGAQDALKKLLREVRWRIRLWTSTSSWSFVAKARRTGGSTRTRATPSSEPVGITRFRS